ncbi:efflux transporter outer membrane subunit [Pontiellaceae bacterium B12227]|nr:efflux transporter outer membrane subunit [Pontiellaceae bacterium B12227]
MRTVLRTAPLLAFGLLTSCALYAPDERTDLNTDIQSQFSLYSETEMDTTNRWWENFQSLELNNLIDEALTNSPTIQQSWARLAQADAAAAKAGAARYPTADYGASTSGNKRETTLGQNPGRSSYHNYDLGLSAAYEVDLWGRVKSQTEAAAFDLAASREQLKTAAITLSSRVALSWTAILAQRLQTEVIRLQLESNKTSLELIEMRFRKSQSTALDVYQQRQTVAGTEALIPRAELTEQLQRNELAVLLGRSDFQALEVAQSTLPTLSELPAIGLPADVLANRPDVRAAGLQLQSADWQVSAARADRLPAIRLTASASYGGNAIDSSDIFDNWLASLAGSITGPIFDGGRRKAEVARTRAVVDERLAAYKETVLNAIKEVEDALISETKQREYIEKVDARLTAARRSYEESINRYRNGLIEYTTVLIQLNTLQNLERDRIVAQYTLLQYRINLYRALGGSWTEELPAVSFNNED